MFVAKNCQRQGRLHQLKQMAGGDIQVTFQAAPLCERGWSWLELLGSPRMLMTGF